MTTETENFVIANELVPCYDSRESCEERIEEAEGAVYYLRNGEAGRPELSARYVVRNGRRWWYVYAKYNYYAGTFGAPKDGPYDRAY